MQGNTVIINSVQGSTNTIIVNSGQGNAVIINSVHGNDVSFNSVQSNTHYQQCAWSQSLSTVCRVTLLTPELLPPFDVRSVSQDHTR